MMQRASDVALRAMCLGALVMRCEFERVVHDISVDLVQQIHSDLAGELNQWMRLERLIEHQSQEERRFFAMPLGTWREREMIDAGWRLEAVGALCWSLGLVGKMPPYDSEFAQADTLRQLGITKPISEFVRSSKLRPAAEVTNARDLAELWHWRARTMQVVREGAHPPPPGYTYEQIVAITAHAAHQKGDIPPPIRDDFPTLGKAYRDLDDSEWASIRSIAQERHFALNWLCGYSTDWDETPTET